MTRAKLEPRLVLRQHSLKQQFDPAARGLARMEPRLDHARVVQHQQVARRDQPWEVGEREVGERVRADVQQATAGALRRGRLRDQLAR